MLAFWGYFALPWRDFGVNKDVEFGHFFEMAKTNILQKIWFIQLLLGKLEGALLWLMSSMNSAALEDISGAGN